MAVRDATVPETDTPRLIVHDPVGVLWKSQLNEQPTRTEAPGALGK
jgi:hypothetical protein